MGKRGEPLEVRNAHFPSMVQIEAYGNGGFRFADMSHRGSLMCIPSGVYGWEPKSFEEITDEALEHVLAEADNIEVLLIGAGDELKPFAESRKAPFREKGIMVDSMSTGAAVRTYNVLLNEDRAVAAVFIAVENT
ncbi:hypothetical protein PsAD2_02182 [Pseudovibrio axinellae]|uniref:Uncharacterized protein n=1 Tax=Pseudovibrio axinellae TaxID=989403 RepID=A0A165YQE8_9HYPH|nr:Mth938-like domain-containing protein [Pseudovibrio axinellae]KZL19123.1 hypothetical protein PsAD2_02182 [Pseudovibrio axinellae]SER34022.1 Uncharacterized conserved protein, contains Mth938-like domain [Pseudovibrio axinellae]